ncbi:hypothetical protein EDB87DRAFT_1624943 [Lactarius vividus]|nr:hypothetical protein EDB87DRAFT_1624943 [Lactarius vividus]
MPSRNYSPSFRISLLMNPECFSVFPWESRCSGVMHLFDALITWDLIGGLQFTNVSLRFFLQLDQNAEVGTYRKGSNVYESLMYAITTWAAKALLLADRTPDDYVHPLAMDKESAEPVGPQGTHPSLVVAFEYDSYNGPILPPWAHGGRFHQESRGEAGWC